MVSYRGEDSSVRLDCPEVNKAIKGTGKNLPDDSSLKTYAVLSANVQPGYIRWGSNCIHSG